MYSCVKMGDKYDDVLFSILKEAKTIPNFFDIIFGFLYRRTDFYNIATDPNLGIGLPIGVAEKLVYQSFKKYSQNTQEIVKTPVPVQEVTITDINTSEPCQSKVKEIKNELLSLESYNGAVYENYSWSQTITDVDIQVKLPEKTPSKQLHVDITSTKICVKLKNSDKIYLEGDLCRKCKVQETIWSLDGCIVQIHLEKASETWWDCLVQSEPKLDFNKMDCSRPFHELSEEAQAKIEELTWNQERKQQGLPTSDQLELEATLKKAWNAEGSPFSGEYDPSKVKLG